jgi:oxidase EvaA
MKNHLEIFPSTYHFLKSAFVKEGQFKASSQIIDWLKEQNEKGKISIKKIRFDQLDQWSINLQKGNIQHKTGKFFSVDGIRIKTSWGAVPEWDQPIINQPEIGYLGFITKRFEGVLHFLVQAKIEPGNVNYVQLSPTLQATRSNYTQVHKGKKPLYIEYFQQAKPQDILLDQIQSEQGARFLKKRNRNIIINVDYDIPVYDNFVWLTLAQIKDLMQFDNLVNMDTRTVVSGIPFGSFDKEVVDFYSFLGRDRSTNAFGRFFLKSALTEDGAMHDIDEIISFLTKLKSIHDLEVTNIPLSQARHWIFGEDMIFHEELKYFKVIAVDIEIGNREVVKWSQPLFEPTQEGLCAFIVKEINGILHFAVQAKLECGNHDIVEFAPTIQCLTGNYRQTIEGTLPFLDYVLHAKPGQVVFDTLQSEEGGRFFREQNRNMIVIADDEVLVELPQNYIWMTLHQLYTFLKFNNYLNIQARSLIAAISFV